MTDDFVSLSLVKQLSKLQQQHAKDWETRLVMQEINTLFELNTNQFNQDISINPHVLSFLGPSQDIYTELSSMPSTWAHSIEESLIDKFTRIESLWDPVSYPQTTLQTKEPVVVDQAQAQALKESILHLQKELHQHQCKWPVHRIQCVQLTTECIKLLLDLLEMAWSLMEEFRLKHEKQMHVHFNECLAMMVDKCNITASSKQCVSYVWENRTLHYSILLTTYDTTTVDALVSLRTRLDQQRRLAHTQLTFATKRIKAFESMGPEFDALAATYFDLLTDIQETQDDIIRINASTDKDPDSV
ncbi:hypothetical protein BDF14DRAFT_1883301 [Spinellus fusiger]|nr:hypothetical protein BDF14DRAFT_1883301 [Spinellus fusiger]